MARKRKKLRKMAVGEEAPLTKKMIALRAAGICILIAILSGWIATNPTILDNFIRCYREQYHLVVHRTTHYCTHPFIEDFLPNVRKHIHGQEDALDQLKNILRSHTDLTFIGIVGTTGVGKTHFINLIREYFPWQHNIHHYVWTSFNQAREKKYEYISEFLTQLSACGHNIVLVDDLTPNDKDIALEYQQMTRDALSKSNRSIKLVVIFVFNILRYTEAMENKYSNYLETLQNLSGIKTVHFNELTNLDVKKCLEKTASKLNVTLEEKQIVKFLQAIDVPKVGCKTVHAMITKVED